MYLNNAGLSGLGKYETVLKGSNLDKLQKELAAQQKNLSKAKKPKDIAKQQSQVNALLARIAEVSGAQTAQANAAVIATPTPAPLTITPPPQVSSAPKTSPITPVLSVDPYPGVAQTLPAVAPPPAAESVATLAPVASNFGPPQQNFGPAFGPPTLSPVTDPQASASESTPAPAPTESKMPLILLGVGALALFMLKKKGRA